MDDRAPGLVLMVADLHRGQTPADVAGLKHVNLHGGAKLLPQVEGRSRATDTCADHSFKETRESSQWASLTTASDDTVKPQKNQNRTVNTKQTSQCLTDQ